MRSRYIADVRIDFDMSYSEALSEVNNFIKSDGKQHFIWTVNPEFVMRAQDDPEFKDILNKSSISTPDGAGLLMADKYLESVKSLRRDILFPLRAFVSGTLLGLKMFLGKDRLPERVTGADLVRKLCKQAADNGHTVLLLGGWEKDIFGRFKEHHGDIAPKAAAELKKLYPELKVIGASSDFDFPPKDDEAALEYIHKQMSSFDVDSIDLVFVAYGPKKQELWLKRNMEKIPAKVGLGIGASLDFIIGTHSRSSQKMIDRNLEWLHRLFTHPWRIRRILRAFPLFPLFVYYLSVKDYKTPQ